MSEPIATKTFTAELVREGLWGSHDIGKYESTMSLHDVEGNAGRGYIEWDIPDLEECVEIGLWYEMRGTQRALTDYDGIFSLPIEAIALLRSVNIIVDKEFE